MKILLFGAGGQVGWELQRALAPLGPVVALERSQRSGLCSDLADLDGIAATVRAVKPDAIVNAAAHTAVDKAEAEPELAHRLNAEAPAVLAREAAALGACLVHYSTDYVFDGSGSSPRGEDAPTAPLNVYGASKLAGEDALRASGARHLILRTSWVYGSRGGNFARTMLRLAQERDRLTVIDDQHGAPTGADLIADVSAHALRTLMSGDASGGTYHLVAAGETTWHGYATRVIEAARAAGWPIQVATDAVVAVPSSGFVTAAKRPANSRLDTSRLRRDFGLHLPPWEYGVDRLLAEIFAAAPPR